MAAAHEVPPHHQLLAERRTAEQDGAGRTVAPVDDVQLRAARPLIRQIRDVDGGAADLDRALVEQHAVFERGVDVEGQRGSGVEVELRAEQRRERVHRRAAVCEVAEEYPQGRAADRAGRGHEVREIAAGVARGVGQRDPQLHAVQDAGRRGRHLGVADPGACGHQVEFAWAHHRMDSGAVPVFHLTTEKPTHRL
ncbi:hypothetical protein EB73_42285 [Mycobacterium sp. SWH-M3]|nr:hypothetical protein EB73_42285 [Mycobacterium sp. SWH-M3]